MVTEIIIIINASFIKLILLYTSKINPFFQRKFLPAKTEKDVFDILNLKYFEPYERNC